ncbi:peptidylprolyl isomerase [Deinococcus sp. Marseille-Q6407]|uniref:FKBP-type peptidyl-prolyl cis-trans isomerase n=1 Tax=Deinococcus sp. Marseille-Q6407 TaxID=2969223 RepID=UPI0021C081EC|nr:peptidylprolyl isomerase [Deinococcus sp. Marseille-Q6407]
MQIAKDKVAEIDYILRVEGEIVDRSEDGEPLTYLHGHGNIIPGLENALEGKSAGDQVKVTVSPEEGYGVYDEENTDLLDLADFDDDVEVGATYFGETDDGQLVPFTVLGLNDGKVEVDYNHMLAGETLDFEVTVRDVRDATPEELEHGHAHLGGMEEDDEISED